MLMVVEQTLHRMKALRLPGAATAFWRNSRVLAENSHSLNECLGLLLDREHISRTSATGEGSSSTLDRPLMA